jgi:hypothetical protein
MSTCDHYLCKYIFCCEAALQDIPFKSGFYERVAPSSPKNTTPNDALECQWLGKMPACLGACRLQQPSA